MPLYPLRSVGMSSLCFESAASFFLLNNTLCKTLNTQLRSIWTNTNTSAVHRLSTALQPGATACSDSSLFLNVFLIQWDKPLRLRGRPLRQPHRHTTSSPP